MKLPNPKKEIDSLETKTAIKVDRYTAPASVFGKTNLNIRDFKNQSKYQKLKAPPPVSLGTGAQSAVAGETLGPEEAALQGVKWKDRQ